jgi:Cdc6-like AAA superfamily ATPase
MTISTFLDSTEVAALETHLEEAIRSSREGVRRFVEPASGTLTRATSRTHHLVFGRRGSGKSSLLRKAAQDLTVDRRPIAFVDLESFKGHEYPDVLISVLIETFNRFAEWLETAAIAPTNKASFWERLFGRKPTRPPFDKKKAQELSAELRKELAVLRNLLFSEDKVEIEAILSSKTAESQAISANIGTKAIGLELGAADRSEASAETSQQQTARYIHSKLQYLHRHTLDYQALFRRMADLSGGDAYLFLDDLYHIPRRNQAPVLDYFHRVAKGNNLWLKIGTIRHRTQWYIHGDPPVGVKIGDDISEIDLDLTLEKYKITSAFLEKILDTFLEESGVARNAFLVRHALDRLVLASGGVARDFLGLLRRSILVAKERGDTARGDKVGVEDVNGAAGEYDSSKREELTRDTLDDRQLLENEFGQIGRFVNHYSKANVFLMDKGLPDSELAPIEELVDLRLVHRVRSRVTVADRPGKTFEAFMLDVSQYTASRKKRELEIIEFWRDDAVDSIRRPGLIYKEWDGTKVITKIPPLPRE